jgi:alpha-tubulin suppressor-like RCC1 family protein
MEPYGHGVLVKWTTRTKYYNTFSSPVQIPGTTWSSISGGRTHSLATKTDNTLWAWGLMVNGQLGQNDTNITFITSTNTRNHMEFYQWWL